MPNPIRLASVRMAAIRWKAGYSFLTKSRAPVYFT
jgi:hypothetical protein